MDVTPAADQRSRPGPPEWFTGSVWLQPLAEGRPPSRLRVFRVTFAPGARTAWHTHPVGQILHIVSGRARIGHADGTVRELSPGDGVRFEPGERHWHGAAPDTVMVHLAMQEADEAGTTADWAQHVTDEEYDA